MLAVEPLLAGRYAHVRELGRGASGRVLLVEDRIEGGLRAVKIVGAEDAERLRWELTLLASIAHPGLARVCELVTISEPLGPPFRLEPGAAALVEEHVDGPSASERVAAFATDEERVRFAVTIGIAVARALSAIHAQGLVHGDVKPANVVVPEDPSAAKLIDLGLARAPGISSTVSGTPAFLAPEAWLGERSFATDLYALGATIHALASGESAYDTQKTSSVPTARALIARPSAWELPSATPMALRRLVADLLADTPGVRPASAREVAMRLAALASEVSATVPDVASLSETPSGVERAARAALRPLVGRQEQLAALVDRLRGPGLIAIAGPSGSGKSRLVREAVRARQSDAARAGQRVPTYVVAVDRVPRVHHDAIVHLGESALDADTLRASIDAAAVDGVDLCVVVESAADPDAITLGPLEPAALRRLLADLLEVDPSPALLDAARAASGGLPGRLCRLVAEGYEAGLDPSRPATLEELGRRARDGALIPASALPLAELLALAGALDAGSAAHLLSERASEQAVLLTSLGLAHEDRGRIALRADLRASLPMTAERRRHLAERLAGVELDAHAQGHVRAALGDHEGAERAFLEAIDRARADGDPERAAAIGGEARLLCDSLALCLKTADALRAQARERDAIAILKDRAEPEALALRAELARLLGDLDAARYDAERAKTPGARAVLARIAIAEGDLDRAMVACEGAGDAAPIDAARLWESRCLAELSRGQLDDAARSAERATLAAQRSGSLAAEARAIAIEGAVLSASGRADEAMQRHERAFALADRAGERHAAASFLVNAGLGRLDRGAPGPAIEALREGARRLTELARRTDAARALYNLGNAAALIGDDDVAEDAIRRARVWAEEHGDRTACAYAAIVESELALRAGKIDLAEDELAQAWEDDGTPPPVRATVGARLAIVHAVQGHLEAAHEIVLAAEDLAKGTPALAEVAIARARLALARGEGAGEEAEHALRAATGWETELRAALLGAETFDREGRTHDASACAARARALLDGALSTLPPRARSLLRAVPAYQRALGSAPSAARSDGDARWRALAQHAKRIVKETRLARLYETIVDAAVELADAERGFLVARTPDGALRVLSARAFGASIEGERPSESIATRVLDSGRPLVALDAAEDERLERAASVHRMALRSVLAAPLPARSDRALAIVLDDRLRPGAFDDATVALLADLAELSAGAIDAAEARRIERRDLRRLARDRERLKAHVESQEVLLGELRRTDSEAFAGIVAQSAAMRRALHLALRVAPSDVPVLLRGESGTGKELAARAVHDASTRREAPYVSENVSAIPETLLESALFGHVRGAFTGADRVRRGLFEIADGGTLFLDEVGEMSEPMQAKLLRVLQDGELRPIGSEHARKVDVRLVTATHRDLERLVLEKRFREDLFYRIAVVQVHLPPLRERSEDVAPLVAAFLERHAPDRRVRVDREAMAALRAYAWPGNVRQLENEVRRSLVLADDVIGVEHLSPAVRGERTDAPIDELDLKGQIDALERRLIRTALDRTSGNQTRAAELLGLSRYGLQKMIKRLAM